MSRGIWSTCATTIAFPIHKVVLSIILQTKNLETVHQLSDIGTQNIPAGCHYLAGVEILPLYFAAR